MGRTSGWKTRPSGAITGLVVLALIPLMAVGCTTAGSAGGPSTIAAASAAPSGSPSKVAPSQDASATSTPQPSVAPSPSAATCLNGITLPKGVDARACRPLPPGIGRARTSDGSSSTAYLYLPSGNIGCDLSKGKVSSVDCYAYEHSWKLPPALARGCDPNLECGSALIMVDGKVRASSRGDVPGWANALSEGKKQYVLGYGRMVAFESYACLAQPTGLTCWSGITGHGFLLSRARIVYW